MKDLDAMARPYLIWSLKWSAWYRPGAHGYTDDIAQAGVFTDHPVTPGVTKRVYYEEALADIEKRRAQIAEQGRALDDVEAAIRSLFSPESTKGPGPSI